MHRRRDEGLGALEAQHPGIASLHKDASGAIVISEEEMAELLGEQKDTANELVDLNQLLLAAH